MDIQIVHIIIVLVSFLIGKYPSNKTSKIILWILSISLILQIIQLNWAITLGYIGLLTGAIILSINSFKITKNSRSSLIYTLGITVPAIINLVFTIQNYPYTSMLIYTQILPIIFWVIVVTRNKSRLNPNFNSLTMMTFWSLTQFIIYQTT